MRTKRFAFLKGFRKIEGALGGIDLLKDGLPGEICDVPGIYIVEAMDGFRFPYPKGASDIIYIGMAKDLCRRFREHRSELKKLDLDEDYGIKQRYVISSKYQYMHYHRARVYWYDCRRFQDPKNMESWVLGQFYKKYRAMPVGNGARSFEVEEF